MRGAVIHAPGDVRFETLDDPTTARRFGTVGHTVALICRSTQHLDDLTAELAGDGIKARGFAAYVLDIEPLDAALSSRGPSPA